MCGALRTSDPIKYSLCRTNKIKHLRQMINNTAACTLQPHYMCIIICMCVARMMFSMHFFGLVGLFACECDSFFDTVIKPPYKMGFTRKWKSSEPWISYRNRRTPDSHIYKNILEPEWKKNHRKKEEEEEYWNVWYSFCWYTKVHSQHSNGSKGRFQNTKTTKTMPITMLWTNK